MSTAPVVRWTETQMPLDVMPLPALLIFAARLDVDVGVVLSCSLFFHLFFFFCLSFFH
jgi:hypothetical protein